jgi:vanillate monooxygenase ferredoxin subunit
MSELMVRVREVKQEALDVKSFRLVSADGSALPSFTAGSHVDVHVAPGLVRQYSLCNSPFDSSGYRIAVKKEPESRGGSRGMHDGLKDGDVLKISEPRNHFKVHAAAKRHLLLAGGIGITPILSMAHYLQAAGSSFELQYFSRSIQHTAFHELLSGPEFKGKVSFHYALEPEAVRAYLRKLLWHRADGAHLYLCGPRPFMDLVESTAAATWPPEAVHLEYFTADPASLSGPRETFTVKLARSGGEYTIPADKSIVELLAAHGVHIETSCEQGVCGTCLTGLLEGTPDHRDVFLTDEEKEACDKMMPCVSRAKSEVLVLDL